MNQPLGKFVGNSLEVYECIKILQNEADEKMLPTLELSFELTAHLLVLCEISKNISDAKSKISDLINSGEALENSNKISNFKAATQKFATIPKVCRRKILFKLKSNQIKKVLSKK